MICECEHPSTNVNFYREYIAASSRCEKYRVNFQLLARPEDDNDRL